MTEKEQNRLIYLALALGAIALLWAAFRKTPVGQYIESGAWVPKMADINIPALGGGDIIIEPLQFADWGPRDEKTLGPANTTEGKDGCGCNAFICPPENSGLATFTPNIMNAALYSMPLSGNIYLGY